ncbi:hypothetical protein KCU88_g388, partial [Aureobasidium melanogenum]
MGRHDHNSSDASQALMVEQQGDMETRIFPWAQSVAESETRVDWANLHVTDPCSCKIVCHELRVNRDFRLQGSLCLKVVVQLAAALLL